MYETKKQNKSLNLYRFFVLFIVVEAIIILISCQRSFQKEYKKAKQAIQKEQFNLAKTHLLKSLKKAESISSKYKVYMELAELTHFKIRNHREAIEFYQQAIAHSQNQQEIVLPNERQAFIYSNNLREYEKAIIKYNQLLNINSIPDSKKIDNHIQLAQLYYNMDKFFQARLEVNRILKHSLNKEQEFKVHLLLGNIFFSGKTIHKAILKYEKVIREHPKMAIRHKVYYSLSLSYEEEKNFDKALSILKEFLSKATEKDTVYIESKIQNLQERRISSPGFRIKSESKQ